MTTAMNSNAVSHGRRWFAGVTLEAVAVDPSASLLQAEPWHIIQPLSFLSKDCQKKM